MTRVGLVGCGDWGRHILRDLRALGCEVAVVARSAESRGRAEAGGAASIVSSVRELPEVEGAVVASLTSTHAGVLDELLERDVPVFVEKPLTSDIASAERIAARAPDRVFVMDKWRYHSGVHVLRDIARTGELGPVTGLRCTRVELASPHGDVHSAWTLMPHDLAIALEVLGSVPTPASAVADAASETLITVCAGPPWVVIETGVLYSERRREVRLHCKDGVAVLGDGGESVLVLREGVAEEWRSFPKEMPLLAELEAFVAHLSGGPPPKSSVAEGLLQVRAIERALELAQARR